MEHPQQIIVNERIGDLRREAEAFRTARLVGHGTGGGRGHATGSGGDPHRRARVRIGHWLIGVGMAVSGSSGDPHGGTAGNAA